MALDLEALARARARGPQMKMETEIHMPISDVPRAQNRVKGTARLAPALPGVSSSRQCRLCGAWFTDAAIVDGLESMGTMCAEHAPLEERERWALCSADADPREPRRRIAPAYCRTFRYEHMLERLKVRDDLLPADPSIEPPVMSDGRRSWHKLPEIPARPPVRPAPPRPRGPAAGF